MTAFFYPSPRPGLGELGMSGLEGLHSPSRLFVFVFGISIRLVLPALRLVSTGLMYFENHTLDLVSYSKYILFVQSSRQYSA